MFDLLAERGGGGTRDVGGEEGVVGVAGVAGRFGGGCRVCKVEYISQKKSSHQLR
jgi:hypothetical protein